MKHNWKVRKLGEVCEIINGGTPKTIIPDYWNGEHLWITPAEMGKRDTPYIKQTERMLSDSGLKNSSAQLLPSYSVILSSRAPIGHLVINTKPMATNQGCKGLAPSKSVFYKYLYFYLLSNVDYLDSLGTGATFRELSGGKLKEVTIPLPPLPEQKRIVAILDEAFAAIAKAIENAKKNLANAREVFESYLNNIFANPGKGWEEKRLGEVCKNVEYGTSTKSEKQGKVPVIRMGNIQNGEIDWNELVFTNDNDEIVKYRLKKNDVLFNRTNSEELVGKTAIYKGEQPAIFAGYLIRINYMKEKINPEFLNIWLNRKSIRNYGFTVMKSSVNQANINGSKLRGYPIITPPLLEQKLIVIKFDALLAQTKRLEEIYQQKITALDELKKSVLSKAFKGEL